MRTVWNHAARPRLSCPSVPSHNPVPGVLSRRTTSAPTRRQVTFQDAFTILLAPVLATALIADTSWKDKRRKDWDKKISEVEEEIGRLRASECQTWIALQQRSVRLGAIHQRRSYATAAASSLTMRADADDIIEPPDWGKMETLPGSILQVAAQESNNLLDSLTLEDEAVKAFKRVERLVAVKLAIAMILHLHMGNSPRFANLNSNYQFDSHSTPENLSDLIGRLKQVRRSLWSLKRSELVRNASRLATPTSKPSDLDEDLIHLIRNFNAHSMTVPFFVETVARKILQSKESPSHKGYLALLRTLSRAGYPDMSYRIIAAIDESEVPLDSRAVYSILLHLGKNQDAYNFDRFLHNLTRINRPENPNHEWEWWRLNGTQVPVPVSQDTRILQALVYTALHCDQPHKAEAWASILRDKSHGQNDKAYVLNNFLRYYSSKSDWRRGKAWIHAAQSWAPSLASDSLRGLQRIILSMLDLCVACGKNEIYVKIIEAAANSGIGVFQADEGQRIAFSPRSEGILSEWERLNRQNLSSCENDQSDEARAIKFQLSLESELGAFKNTDQSTLSWSRPEQSHLPQYRSPAGLQESDAHMENVTGQLQDLREEQQAELIKLRTELSRFKTFYSSLSASNDKVALQQLKVEAELKALRAELSRTRSQNQSLAGEQPTLKREIEKLRAELNESRPQHQSSIVTQTLPGANQPTLKKKIEKPRAEQLTIEAGRKRESEQQHQESQKVQSEFSRHKAPHSSAPAPHSSLEELSSHVQNFTLESAHLNARSSEPQVERPSATHPIDMPLAFVEPFIKPQGHGYYIAPVEEGWVHKQEHQLHLQPRPQPVANSLVSDLTVAGERPAVRRVTQKIARSFRRVEFDAPRAKVSHSDPEIVYLSVNVDA